MLTIAWNNFPGVEMLPSRSIQGLVFIAVFAAGCGIGPLESPSPSRPVIPTVPSTPEVVGRLILTLDTREAFVGLKLRLHVAAMNTLGSPMNSFLAQVTSSNPQVAAFDRSELVQMQYPNAAAKSEVFLFISMAGEGNAVLRVRLGDVTDSVMLNVRPLPPALNVLAVDSFTVVEYREECAWACPYLIYVPLLKLREPTGTTFADVIAVEFSVPTMSTGYCTMGGLHFSGGLAAHVNSIDPYPWANDMIFASLNGTPVPDGPARARVIVRDASGNYGLIEATAPIQRMVPKPGFPMSLFGSVPWSCNNRTSGSS